MSTKFKSIKPVIGIFLIFVTWFLAEKLVNSGDTSFFPTIKGTFFRLYTNLTGEHVYGHTIYAHLGSSIIRWLKGFGLALVISIPIGIIIGYYPTLFQIFIPFITFIQVIPGLAWIPIALLIFGLGEQSTIFMIFITSLPPIILNSAAGIREMPHVFKRASSMIGIKGLKLFVKILLPAASLSIVNGSRIALASGWRVLIAAEMIVGSSIGLGYVIIQSRWSLDFEAAFVMIILIVTIGILIEKVLFQLIENRIRKIIGFERNL